MSAKLNALGFALCIGRAHASLSLRIEEDLGAFHGLSYGDFTLLYLLGHARDGRLPIATLARQLGLSVFALTRKLVQLEKIGLAAREPACGGSGGRQAAIRPGGKKLMQEATGTAAAVCAEALQAMDPARMSEIQQTLSAICGDEPALA